MPDARGLNLKGTQGDKWTATSARSIALVTCGIKHLQSWFIQYCCIHLREANATEQLLIGLFMYITVTTCVG